LEDPPRGFLVAFPQGHRLCRHNVIETIETTESKATLGTIDAIDGIDGIDGIRYHREALDATGRI
jgi:hypothetical protein